MIAPENSPGTKPRLASYDGSRLVRGRSFIVEALWLACQAVFVRSWIPGSSHRRFLLRLFGGRIAKGVVIKPGIRVKFPWRLSIGADSWIGEDVWIDNLAPVTIAADCCLSQGSYLCTGSHDWGDQGFGLITKPIDIREGAWIAARTSIGPGVTVGEGAVLAFASVAVTDLDPWTIYQGNPAAPVKPRRISDPIKGLAGPKAGGLSSSGPHEQ